MSHSAAHRMNQYMVSRNTSHRVGFAVRIKACCLIYCHCQSLLFHYGLQCLSCITFKYVLTEFRLLNQRCLSVKYSTYSQGALDSAIRNFSIYP